MREITRLNLEEFLREYVPPIPRFRGKYWYVVTKGRNQHRKKLRQELRAALRAGKVFVMEVHHHHVRDREPFGSIH